jgi:hypothetical protein
MLCAHFGGLETHEVFEETEEISVLEAGIVFEVDEAYEILEVDEASLEGLDLLYLELLVG